MAEAEGASAVVAAVEGGESEAVAKEVVNEVVTEAVQEAAAAADNKQETADGGAESSEGGEGEGDATGATDDGAENGADGAGGAAETGADGEKTEEGEETKEDVIKTVFSKVLLRRSEWMFVDTPAGAASLIWRNDTKKTCRVRLHPEVELAEGEEQEREFSCDVVKTRYTLKQDERLDVAWANLATAQAEKKDKNWAMACSHYSRCVDYLKGVQEESVSAAEFAKAQENLISTYVDLAHASEKLADDMDANKRPAKAQPGVRAPSATGLRKNALRYCHESIRRNEGARNPVLFVRAYYCIAKLRCSQSEFEKAIGAAKQGQKAPADVVQALNKKMRRKYNKFLAGLKQVQAKAVKARKAHKKKNGGFLLKASGGTSPPDTPTSTTSSLPGTPTSGPTTATAAPAAASPANASAVGSGSTSRPATTRSALRTAASPTKSKHITFDAAAADGDDDTTLDEDIASIAAAAPAPSGNSFMSSWWGAATAVGLLALTAYALVKASSRR